MANKSVAQSNIENVALRHFAERAYLDYSMYVVLDRALPHISDGLKPVQRRLIYAMSELALHANAKPKKSARTVGDVLGKYHPHGESACYEAMVLMAQSFSFRYPLIDGQGNWGSPDDPKSFAAMRYTEAKLTLFADVLLSELKQGTVDWGANFDGTMEEPKVLPSRLPQVLLNGAAGIAVGMATDVPPHNLREVAAACIRLLEAPKSTVADLCEHIPGPDFPTEAEIISTPDQLREIYEQGLGSVRMRAVYGVEDGAIVIHALPYQVSGSKILEQIQQQRITKKLPWVEFMRDESDHENPTRIVIFPRSNRVDIEKLMLHLFATTDLERTYRVNLNVIGLDGKPQRKNLRALLTEWLKFRQQTIVRRLQFRLDKVETRLHVLEGLRIAYLNLDEVIRIIRENDKPKPILMKKFKLSDKQTEAILELKLRQLAGLEELRIEREFNELSAEQKNLKGLLGSKAKLKKLLRSEIIEDAEAYGDGRKSPIVARIEAKAIDARELAQVENISIILSTRGWVRSAKGHDIDATSLSYKAGDALLSVARGRSNQFAVFLDNTGRAYTLDAHDLPSARGQGEPLAGRLNPPDGATFCGLLIDEDDRHYLLGSSYGYGFIVQVNDLHSKNKAGKKVVSVTKGAVLLPPIVIPDEREHSELRVALVTSQGYLLVHDLEELSVMSKGKGLKMINVPPAKLKNGEERVSYMTVIAVDQPLMVISGKRHLTLKPKDWQNFYANRGKRGRKLPRGYQRVDGIVPVE